MNEMDVILAGFATGGIAALLVVGCAYSHLRHLYRSIRIGSNSLVVSRRLTELEERVIQLKIQIVALQVDR